MKRFTFALLICPLYSKALNDGDISTTPRHQEAVMARTKKPIDLMFPYFNPSQVDQSHLSPIDLTLTWPFTCVAASHPTIKLTLDPNAIKAGADISSNPNIGFQIHGIKGEEHILINTNPDEITRENYTGITYTSTKEIQADEFKLSFLYFSQKVPNATVSTTHFEVELLCKNQTLLKYIKAENHAVVLKVNSASTSTAGAALAAFTSLLLFA
ncbi:hypothetical protein DSO57_1035165 [Entomophthora muscae]|uniref:Uncharacterized protein n=1 Tax=Entomophthora muscae TaxID=34485 RepID=A0ACC2U982_9FUNG|nr:hypothetical protein DSO57_1035165 [Entomophthora muscae]